MDLDLVGERLHHGVWANAVDGRSGPDQCAWRWADQAVGPGGLPSPGDGGARRPTSCWPTGGRRCATAAPSTPLWPNGSRWRWSTGSRSNTGCSGPRRRTIRPAGGRDAGELAGDQWAAVAAAGGGARIIAPAGSGKTRVLTERARLLLRGWGLPPDAVALVAYNVRAANEMREPAGRRGRRPDHGP